MLVPLLAPVLSAHRAARGASAEGAGGFIDVGANVGETAEIVLGAWTRHADRFYHHHLGVAPALRDAGHPPPGHQDELAFFELLEASPETFALLERRAAASLWGNSHVRTRNVAAGNATGVTRFCVYGAGNENSGLAAAAEAPPVGAAAATNCSDVPVTTLRDFLNAGPGGAAARVFFLKMCAGDGLARAARGTRRASLFPPPPPASSLLHPARAAATLRAPRRSCSRARATFLPQQGFPL